MQKTLITKTSKSICAATSPIEGFKGEKEWENGKIPFWKLWQTTWAMWRHEPYLRCANVLAAIQGSYGTTEPPLPSLLPGKLCSAAARAVRQTPLAAPAQGSPARHGDAWMCTICFCLWLGCGGALSSGGFFPGWKELRELKSWLLPWVACKPSERDWSVAVGSSLSDVTRSN